MRQDNQFFRRKLKHKHSLKNSWSGPLCYLILTFFLHSVSSLSSSLVLEVTRLITVGDFDDKASLIALSSSEYLTWSCSCSFLELVRRPLRARTSSWECFHFCWVVSNFVCSSEFSAVSALHCSLAYIMNYKVWDQAVWFTGLGAVTLRLLRPWYGQSNTNSGLL